MRIFRCSERFAGRPELDARRPAALYRDGCRWGGRRPFGPAEMQIAPLGGAPPEAAMPLKGDL